MISGDAVATEVKKLGGEGIRITWSDGHQAIYPHAYLREGCRCASCVHEWSGEKIISAESIPEDIMPTEIEAVGHYAISIHWNDGHVTGIYPFDYLKQICPCATCRLERDAPPA
ncbi:MAG: DUF971 domain-containing protein [Nitrospiria bacterium]